MKVLHVAYSLEESSAATRIAKASEESVEVLFLLGRRSSYSFVRDRQLLPLTTNFIGVLFHTINILFNKFLKVSDNEIFSTGVFCSVQSLLLKRLIKKFNIEVLHIHWGGYSFIPVQSLKNLPVKVIITAHDYNYFTGGCHIPMGCEQIKEGCSYCPLINSSGNGEKLVSILKRKRELVLKELKSTLQIIAPSRYTENYVKWVYPFLSLRVIPNPLDHYYLSQCIESCSYYYKNEFKKRKGAFQICIVAVQKSEADNKGYDLLSRVLCELLDLRNDIRIVQVSGTRLNIKPEKITYIDRLKSKDLANIYTSSDLTLVPSKFETFSQVTLESISVCTPVIAFDKSGPADIIENDITGKLVSSFDEVAYLQSIIDFVEYKSKNLTLMQVNVASLRSKFSPENISSLYLDAYNV